MIFESLALAIGLGISTQAILASWSDWAGVALPRELMLALTVLITSGLCFLGRKRHEKSARWLPWALASLVLAFCFALAAPQFFPLSLRWDGANHIAVIRFLETGSLHRELVLRSFSLSWGGDLGSYPWGFHSAVVQLGWLLGEDPVRVIQGFVALQLSILIGVLACARMRSGLPLECQAILGAGLLVLAASLIHFDYWTQLSGLFLLSILVLSLETDRRWLGIGTLVAGVGLVYPLFLVPALFVALSPAFVRKSRHDRTRAILSAGMGLLLTLPYWMPTLQLNWVRIQTRGGPLSGGVWLYVMILLGVGVSVSRSLRARKVDPVSSCVLGLAALPLLFRTLGTQAYWVDKAVVSCGFFALPLYIDAVYRRFGRLACGLAAVASLVVVVLCGRGVGWPRPAFGSSTYELSRSLRRGELGSRVLPFGSALDLGWLEALSFPGRPDLPPEFKELASGDAISARPLELWDQYARRGFGHRDSLVVREGLPDLETLERKFAEAGFSMQRRLGIWRIYGRLSLGHADP